MDGGIDLARDEDPTNIVDAQINAYVAGDASRFAACYAEDAICTNLPSGEIMASGRAAIETRWGALFARRKASFDLVRRIILGRMVIDHERVTDTGTGRTIEAIASYEVKDGLIQNVWFLGDVVEVTPARSG
jgi:hypothetical protein